MRRLLVALLFLLAGTARAEVPILHDAAALKSAIDQAGRNGQPVVVHFFALWCDDCMAEMPLLRRVLNHASNRGAAILLVSLDPPRKVGAVGRFLRRYPIEGTACLLDARNPDPVIAVIDPSWHASLPATFIFRNGRRIASFKGPLKLESELEKALPKNDPVPPPTP